MSRNLKLKWAFAFEGDTVRSAQPVVVGNRVFTGSASGAVYSLDAETGCSYWKYSAGAMVRNAISIGQAGGKTIAYFGDIRANVHALDVATGELLWKVKVDDHPVARITGSPAFYAGRLYVPVSSVEEASAMSPTYECCKFRGSVVALDGATGRQIWKSYSVVDPPRQLEKGATRPQPWGPAGGAIWSAPTIDVKKKVVYAATGNSYTNVSIDTSDAILAFDLETGSLLWARQVQPKDNFTMGCGAGRELSSRPRSRFRFRSVADPARTSGRQANPDLRAEVRHPLGTRSRRSRQDSVADACGAGRCARRHRVGADGRSRERLCGRFRPARSPARTVQADCTP